MKNFYVYVLLDTRKPGSYIYGKSSFGHEPFYVGKGTGRRYLDHMNSNYLAKNSHKRNKIDRIKAQGYEVKIVLLETNLSEKKAFEREIHFIELIGRSDLGKGPLVNKTNGGEGTSGRIALPFSKEHREKLSAKTKQVFANRTAEEWDRIKSKIKKGLSSVSDEEWEVINRSRGAKSKERWKNLSPQERETYLQNLSNGWKKRTSEQNAQSAIRRSEAGKKWRAAKSKDWWDAVAAKRRYNKKLHSCGVIPTYGL